MNKFKLLSLVVIIFIISGCTIDISKEEKKEEEDSKTVEEVKDVVSVGLVSDSENPLGIEDYGLASKYNVYLDEYKDVDVRIKKVYSDSDSIINRYNLSNPDDVISLKDGYKLVVLDYEVIFFDFETESFGDDARLDVDVVDAFNNLFVVDGVKQYIDIYVLEEDNSVFNGDSGTVKIAFMIPEDVDTYLIKFGTYQHTIAYYKV